MSSLLNASRVKVSRMKSLSSVFFSSNPPKGNGSGNNKKGPDPVHHPFVNRNRRTRIQRSVGVDSSSRAEEVASNPNRIFRPVVVVPSKDDINVGAELVGKISKQEVLKVLNHFNLRTEVQNVAKAHGLDSYLFQQAYISFRKYCMDLEYLPSELYVTLSDLIKGHGHVDDLFPYFLSHARKVFPHLECIEELKVISFYCYEVLW